MKRKKLVAAARLRGMSYQEVYDYFANTGKEGGIEFHNIKTGRPYSLGTIVKDCKKLEALWLEDAKGDIGKHKARVFRELQEIKKLAWFKKEVKQLISLSARESALLGLDAPKEVKGDFEMGGDIIINHMPAEEYIKNQKDLPQPNKDDKES